MRLTSSDVVINAAEEVLRQIVDAYTAPDLTFEDLRRSLQGAEFRDPLMSFSEACRSELRAVRA